MTLAACRVAASCGVAGEAVAVACRVDMPSCLGRRYLAAEDIASADHHLPQSTRSGLKVHVAPDSVVLAGRHSQFLLIVRIPSSHGTWVAVVHVMKL